MNQQWIAHQRLSKGRYLERLAEGALFYTLGGERLSDIEAVKGELAAGREVWSHG